VKLREIESWGVKLRVFEDQGGISKWLVVQGGPVKFPRIWFKRFGRKDNIFWVANKENPLSSPSSSINT
jgi:hypothetical protein